MTLKFAFSIILCALISRGAFEQQNEDKNFRLPANTKPVFYDLQFYPIFDGVNSTFTGIAKITFNANTADDVIVLNLKDLIVNNVTVTDVNTRKKYLIKSKDDKPNDEQYKITLDKSYIKGRNYEVTITYGGKIRNDMTGLYLSSYKEGNQTK